MSSGTEFQRDPPARTRLPGGQHLGDTVPLKKKLQTTRQFNVFLVEDEEFIRERVIEKIAAGRGTVVDYADSAPIAIAKLRESPCDVIILDLELRQGTGFQVLREVRSHSAFRPWIIVFTHFNDAHFRQQTLALGADYFVDKAQGMDSLGEIIDALPLPNGEES